MAKITELLPALKEGKTIEYKGRKVRLSEEYYFVYADEYEENGIVNKPYYLTTNDLVNEWEISKENKPEYVSVQIRKDIYEFLKSLVDEMKHQDNRATQNPVFVVAYNTASGRVNLSKMEKAGIFLTAEACDKHIKNNNYHYPEGSYSYAINLWRNNDMIAVIDSLFRITDEEKPHFIDSYFLN